MVSHPDTAGPEVVNAKEEFHAISTAYKVLTRPELKKQYDAARVQLLGGEAAVKSGFTLSNIRNMDINRGYVADLTSSISSHEIKHEGMMRNLNTGSDWTEMQDKYRNEKWHRLGLDTKKVCLRVFANIILFLFACRVEDTSPLRQLASCMVEYYLWEELCLVLAW